MTEASGGPPTRMIRRRWFQFSLRGFLIAVTVFAVWLGWNVGRARRRGRAIDAIVAIGGTVYFHDLREPLSNGDYIAHFWPDLRRARIVVELDHDICLDARTGSLLAEAIPIDTLDIYDSVDDDALSYLPYLNDGCKLTLYKADNVSTATLEDLQRRMPKVKVGWLKEGDL